MSNSKNKKEMQKQDILEEWKTLKATERKTYRYLTTVMKNVKQEGEEVPKYTEEGKIIETEVYFGNAGDPKETEKKSR